MEVYEFGAEENGDLYGGGGGGSLELDEGINELNDETFGLGDNVGELSYDRYPSPSLNRASDCHLWSWIRREQGKILISWDRHHSSCPMNHPHSMPKGSTNTPSPFRDLPRPPWQPKSH